MNELKIIQNAIFIALQDSPDYCFSDSDVALKKVKDNVFLGRFDPGHWCTEALVIAHTEDGLPSPYDYDFWERVTKIANRKGCKVYWSNVTLFLVGFFQEIKLSSDVLKLIQLGSNAVAETFRCQLECRIEVDNISSPIEQLFYVCWEISRESLINKGNPTLYELSRYVLYPQFPITSGSGERYLIDFAVLRFNADRYRQLLLDWHSRQDLYSDGNYIGDPYPEDRDEECNLNVKIAIELDSYKYHVDQLSPEGFEYQKRRERFLQHDGWTVFSFCGREVNRDPMKCVQEVQQYLCKNKITV